MPDPAKENKTKLLLEALRAAQDDLVSRDNSAENATFYL